MRKFLSAVGVAAVIGGATLVIASQARKSQAGVETVGSVDLNRYVGDWFEIARYPNRFQRQCVDNVKASYSRRQDGRIDVVNSCRTTEGATNAQGVARVVDEATRAKLKVRFAPGFLSFLPFVWGDYWIIGLDEDYRWAVVGSPDRKYLWVLSRTPSLDDATYQRAIETARGNGFDTSRLVKTAQEKASRSRN